MQLYSLVSPGAIRSWIRTLKFKKMIWLFYHWDTAVGHVNTNLWATAGSLVNTTWPGFKPLTLRWCKYNYSPPGGGGPLIQTLDLEMMRWVLYHFATAAGRVNTPFHSLCNWQLDSNPWPWNDEMSALPLCYYCWPCKYNFFPSWCQWHLESNPWPWNDEVNFIPLCYYCWPYKYNFSPPGTIGTLTQLPDLEMMRWVFYHYATAAGYVNTTFFSSWCQWQLDSNPWPWNDEVSVLHCAAAAAAAGHANTSLFSSGASGCRFQTLVLEVTRQELYHCAITAGHVNTTYSALTMPEDLDSNPWEQDKEASVLPLYYYHVNTTQATQALIHQWNRWFFKHFFSTHAACQCTRNNQPPFMTFLTVLLLLAM